jgi:hypothetical protein
MHLVNKLLDHYTGTVLEELDEIMHGDKLVIRCSAAASVNAQTVLASRWVYT